MSDTAAVGSVIGRKRELSAAERFLGEVAERPGVLLLEGEPGIGKMTLWREVLAEAELRGMRVLQGRPAAAAATESEHAGHRSSPSPSAPYPEQG